MSAGEKPIVVDECKGCVNRRPDGTHEWACLECKRWWPDKYETARNPRALPLLGVGL